MIQREETILTEEQYNDLLTETGDPAFSLTLEQYSLALQEKAGGGHTSVMEPFDAVVVGNVIVRVWLENNTLYSERLASEDAGDQAWEQFSVAVSCDETVPPSLAVDGTTVIVFYYDGLAIKSLSSADYGETWSAGQTIATVSSVAFVAAASDARVHFGRISSENFRLGVATYSGGSWSTSYGPYWPFLPSSFDVVVGNQVDAGAASANDIIAMTTDLPPLVKVRAEGTEIIREFERVKGVVVFRYQNGRWSDHWSFDVVDRADVGLERADLRLSTYGDLIFAAYTRIDGRSSRQHPATAVSRSKSGIDWELPYVLTRNLNGPAILLKRGDHAYLLNSKDTFRSPSVGFTGDSKVTQSLDDNALSINLRMGDIREMQVSLTNPLQELDAVTPFSEDASLQARLELGYQVGGRHQVFLGDIDAITGTRKLPTDHEVLVSRDLLARLNGMQADYVQEWPSQQIGGDNYEPTDETEYSGLRKTAPNTGRWKAVNNELCLVSSKTPGVAFTLLASNVWNGSHQAEFTTSITDSEDYAGLVFRAYDKDNFWYACYHADDDKIKLIERRQNEDTVQAETSTKGWSRNTWYSLKVIFRYNYIGVYSSTDGVNWTSEIAYIATGLTATDPAAWKFGDIPIMVGRCGFTGYGYSDNPPTFPPPPPRPPWPSEPAQPETEWPEAVYFGTKAKGIFYTSDFSGPDDPQPTWVPVNDGLPVDTIDGIDYIHVRQFLLDPVNKSRQYLLTGNPDIGHGGLDVYRREDEGNWSAILTRAQANTLTGWSDGYIDGIAVDPLGDGTLYALFSYYLAGTKLLALLQSFDYGGTWSVSTMWSDDYHLHGGWMVQAYGNYVYATANRGAGGDGRLWSSSSGGSGWAETDSLGISVWYPWPHLNPLEPNKCYVNGNGVNGPDLLSVACGAATGTVLQAGLGPERSQAMWFSQADADFQRIVKNSRIYVTTNGWSSKVSGGLITPSVHLMRAPVAGDEDLIILARASGLLEEVPHHIFVMVGDDGTYPIGKAGFDPDNPDTTVSIPWNGLGACIDGIQVVE